MVEHLKPDWSITKTLDYLRDLYPHGRKSALDALWLAAREARVRITGRPCKWANFDTLDIGERENIRDIAWVDFTMEVRGGDWGAVQRRSSPAGISRLPPAMAKLLAPKPKADALSWLNEPTNPQLADGWCRLRICRVDVLSAFPKPLKPKNLARFAPLAAEPAPEPRTVRDPKQFSKYWNNGKGGATELWSLKDALEWRMRAGVPVDQAFREQVEIRTKERDRGWAAFGVRLRPDPDRPDSELIDYEPWLDRPTSMPWGTPLLGIISANDWLTFEPVSDENGRPTSSVRYASSHEDAWARVEFDRDRTQQAWLAISRAEPIQDQREAGRIPSASPSTVRPPQRAMRSHTKREMYDTWLRLAVEHCLTDDGRRRTRGQIVEAIADDEKAKDPFNGKPPDPGSVLRRLNEHYPGWAEKIWAERPGRKKLPSTAS